MATTTNYSWTTPDDTDLVKDGAAAIRTLGSSADTTVKALNPGTTAGDIDYYTAATTKARIAIGTAGQVLQVNSGATAPEWATPSFGGMTLLETLTFSGASVTSSTIAGTYKNLQIIIRNYKPATDGQPLRFRYNGDTGTNYRYDGEFTNGTGAANQNILPVDDGNDNSVSNMLAKIDIPDYANTTAYKICQTFSVNTNSTTTANVNTRYTGGVWFNTNAITSITFFPSSGNFTSGSALIYGVN
jgi:hypothetical protein